MYTRISATYHRLNRTLEIRLDNREMLEVRLSGDFNEEEVFSLLAELYKWVDRVGGEGNIL